MRVVVEVGVDGVCYIFVVVVAFFCVIVDDAVVILYVSCCIAINICIIVVDVRVGAGVVVDNVAVTFVDAVTIDVGDVIVVHVVIFGYCCCLC